MLYSFDDEKRTVVLDGLVVVVVEVTAAAGLEDRGATELLIGRSSGCCLTGVEGAAGAGADEGTGGGGVLGRFTAVV